MALHCTRFRLLTSVFVSCFVWFHHAVLCGVASEWLCVEMRSRVFVSQDFVTIYRAALLATNVI